MGESMNNYFPQPERRKPSKKGTYANLSLEQRIAYDQQQNAAKRATEWEQHNRRAGDREEESSDDQF